MKQISKGLGSIAFALVLAACSRDVSTQPQADQAKNATTLDAFPPAASVFAAAGDITPAVNAFQNALGGLNGNLPGSRLGGRREINWDAVPAAFTNTDDFPGNFFNQPAAGRARGVEFTTPGTGFRTSDVNFADLNPDFGQEFVFFSPVKTFAAVGSNRMTVTFFVPGSDTAATSTGFGLVFSDVDRNGSASIRLFDADGEDLGRFAAPASPGGLSFVGAIFPNAVIARVEITSGRGAVGSDATDIDDRDREPARDLVIMDDFIYGEPIAVAVGSQGEPTAARSRPRGQ